MFFRLSLRQPSIGKIDMTLGPSTTAVALDCSGVARQIKAHTSTGRLRVPSALKITQHHNNICTTILLESLPHSTTSNCATALPQTDQRGKPRYHQPPGGSTIHAGTTRDHRRPCTLLSGRPRLLGHHLPPVATAAAVTSFASAFGPLRSRSRSPDCWGCRWDWWASSPAWLGCRWARLGCTWARWANSPDWLGCSWASPGNRRAMLASTWDWWAST